MDRSRLDIRWLAAAVVALIILVVGIGTCGGVDTGDPEASVRSYFDAVADGDGEDACSVGTEEFQEAAVASVIGTPSQGDSCEETVENVPDEAREVVEDVEAKTIEKTDTTATVEVELKEEGAPAQSYRFPLIREGDEWLIEGPPEQVSE